MVPAWRDFKKTFCDVCTYDKWKFKPKISYIFHFQLVSDGWMAHVLGVKPQITAKFFFLTLGQNNLETKYHSVSVSVTFSKKNPT